MLFPTKPGRLLARAQRRARLTRRAPTPQIAPDDGPSADEPAPERDVHRCAHCGGLLPADIGLWVLMTNGDGVAALCSRACDEQAGAVRPRGT